MSEINISEVTSLSDLETKLLALHDPNLEKQDGGVVQIWQDGEITYQKSGDLLWQRSLHCFAMPPGDETIFPNLPMKLSGTNNSYVNYPGQNYMDVAGMIRKLYKERK